MAEIVYVVQVYEASGARLVVGVTRSADAARALAERDAAATLTRDEVVCIGGKEWRASCGYDFGEGEERAAKWDVLYFWDEHELR